MNKIIVIGAVAGGATVASQIRRLDNESEIVVYEKDRDMSFANCGLPYYLGQVVEDRDYMLSATPEQFKEKKNITVKTFHEAIALNDKEKTITIKNHETGETFEDKYDQLILSPGCRANQLPVQSDRLFTLRNLVDTDKIEQLENMMKDVTEAVHKNTGAPKEHIHVIINEMKKGTYGVNGEWKK